jgi:hypothetical protein
MKLVRITLNWLLYIAGPIWLPVLFYILEIFLIKKLLNLPKEKRCHNYHALFVGDRWLISVKDIKESLE